MNENELLDVLKEAQGIQEISGAENNIPKDGVKEPVASGNVEVIEEEKKDDETLLINKSSDQANVKTEETVEEINLTEEPKNEQQNINYEEAYFTELSKNSGITFKNEVDLLNFIKERSSEPFKDLSPTLQAAIEAERNGVDPYRFMQLAKLDVQQMSDKDVMKELFILKHKDPTSADLALRRWEYDYQDKYTVKIPKFDFDIEREEWESENADLLERQKVMLGTMLT